MSGKAWVVSGRWWRSEFASLGMAMSAPGRVLRQGDLNCGSAMRQDDRTIATGTRDELPAVDAGSRRLPASQVGGVD
ncbi:MULTISPECIES: hypothetical protein [unclassified Streptosporangium]|uniref:hypothetical protein n=1 Tax=unclassified Streptosporangium TaxID=2632669 RepID=UPI002E2A61B2|nr:MULTISPECIES: hypothetical protein [unclassified Streptosporangium]